MQTEVSDPGAESFRDAMRRSIGERWEAVWKAVPAAVEGGDPEGVHDVRVASRRLRAAMDVASSAFPNSWYRPLHRLAKQITRELGAVRDRDVLLEALRNDRAAAPPEEWPGIDLVINRMEREREAARAEMEAFLAKLDASGLIEESRRRFGERPAEPKKRRRDREKPDGGRPDG